MSLNIQDRTEGSARIVTLEGRLDTLTSPQLDRALISAGPGQHIILDLAALDYVSSAGLRCILTTHKRLVREGGGIALAAPSPGVTEILDLSGFKTLLPVYPDSRTAAADL